MQGLFNDRRIDRCGGRVAVYTLRPQRSYRKYNMSKVFLRSDRSADAWPCVRGPIADISRITLATSILNVSQLDTLVLNAGRWS